MDRLSCYSMLVLPREPVKSWLTQVALKQKISPQGIKDSPLVDIAKDANMYLFPCITEVDQFYDFLEKNHKKIFSSELFIWAQDESLWPTDLSYEAFKEWFDVEMHVEVYSGGNFNENDNIMSFLLLPKQNCIDWVNQNKDKINSIWFGFNEINVATARPAAPAFIVKRIEREASGINQFITQNYEALFDLGLSNFSKDESLWPKEKSLETFKGWFDVDIHHFLFDLTKN